MTAGFLYEIGNLRRVRRSGWWLAGVDHPESVAEHSFRCAVVGYVLAKIEGLNAEKTAAMCLFNDLHEARINDLHKLGQKYLDFREAEKKAFLDQSAQVQKEARKGIVGLFTEFYDESTPEGVLARDADLLECALTAMEYKKRGYDTEDWLSNISKLIKTKGAAGLLAEIRATDPDSWWKGQKKIER